MTRNYEAMYKSLKEILKQIIEDDFKK